MLYFVAEIQTIWAYIPIKIIEIGTDQSATYDFLLVIRSNHEPMSYCF